MNEKKPFSPEVRSISLTEEGWKNSSLLFSRVNQREGKKLVKQCGNFFNISIPEGTANGGGGFVTLTTRQLLLRLPFYAWKLRANFSARDRRGVGGKKRIDWNVALFPIETR